MKKTCLQCGKEFEISKEEQEYYRSRHVEIPVYCRSCRKSRRIKKHDAPPKRYFGLIAKRQKRGVRPGGTIGMVFRGKYLFFSLAALLIFSQAIDRRMRTNYHPPASSSAVSANPEKPAKVLIFQNFKLLSEHFEKYGRDMGYTSSEEYLAAANAVVANSAALHKKQADSGDDIYFLTDTNDLVVVSGDGYIRTYFRPADGIDYYNRQ